MLKYGIIWIVGLAIAVASGLAAAGAVAKSRAPELAVSLQPANGFAFERLASNFLKAAVAANDGQFPNSVDLVAASFAKQAFLSEPLTPEAIAVLALGSTEGKKRELMHQAFALSRRQQLVVGWMIVDAGTREDIPSVLGLYDTMLRTSSSAASVIIPTMAGALANKSFVEPFAELLTKKPPWSRRFWGAVVATPEAIENAALLRERLYAADEIKENYRDSRLIEALVKNKQFEAAETLFQLLEGQTKTDSLVKNGSFEREPEYPPLDWQLFSTGEYGAAVTNGQLKLSAIGHSGGLFARQLIKLPAKIVTLNINASDPVSDNDQIIVSLQCAQALKNTPQAIRILIKRKLTISKIDNSKSGCSFFRLDIAGRASERGGGFDIALDSISLRSDKISNQK